MEIFFLLGMFLLAQNLSMVMRMSGLHYFCQHNVTENIIMLCWKLIASSTHSVDVFGERVLLHIPQNVEEDYRSVLLSSSFAHSPVVGLPKTQTQPQLHSKPATTTMDNAVSTCVSTSISPPPHIVHHTIPPKPPLSRARSQDALETNKSLVKHEENLKKNGEGQKIEMGRGGGGGGDGNVNSMQTTSIESSLPTISSIENTSSQTQVISVSDENLGINLPTNKETILLTSSQEYSTSSICSLSSSITLATSLTAPAAATVTSIASAPVLVTTSSTHSLNALAVSPTTAFTSLKTSSSAGIVGQKALNNGQKQILDVIDDKSEDKNGNCEGGDGWREAAEEKEKIMVEGEISLQDQKSGVLPNNIINKNKVRDKVLEAELQQQRREQEQQVRKHLDLITNPHYTIRTVGDSIKALPSLNIAQYLKDPRMCYKIALLRHKPIYHPLLPSPHMDNYQTQFKPSSFFFFFFNFLFL
jgi:hypothetical protein